jgi:hypothetical protein
MFTPFAFIKTEAATTPSPADIYIDAVLAAGGTLSSTQQTAISTFYNSLESNGIYSKIHAIWPFLGSTAASNAIEFKDPGGSFDLTFNGTWSHSATGSYATDTSGNFADTGFDPSLYNSTTNFSWGIMVVSASVTPGFSGIGNTSNNYILMGQGSTAPGTSRNNYMWNGAESDDWSSDEYEIGVLTIVNRSNSNTWTRNFFQNGVGTLNQASFTNTLTSYSANLYLNAINGDYGLARNTMSGLWLFSYTGESLTNTNLQNLADAVNTLQIAFNRNLW